ncbi:DUF4157 domain-containing protein [Paraliomyxa miuraensis]|nr:DUF4157 domain-containing protein [Paraliomyxa miuraensis]
MKASGAGRPLEPQLRRSMEASFGADFSGVRVHQGPAAPSMGALAFTMGEELHFAPGLYDPTTREGLELLGHELAHVVQQREGRVGNPLGMGIAIVQDPRLEAAADRLARRVADELWLARQHEHEPARVARPHGWRSARVILPSLLSDGSLTVISWNVRHIRPDKVDDYGDYIASQINGADVVFFYENKQKNNKEGACIKKLIALMKKTTKVEWGGIVTPVLTNENVLTIYRKTRGSTTITVTPDDGYMNKLKLAADKGVRSSMNQTIMSNLSIGWAEARIPAIVDVTVAPKVSRKQTFKVSAWHAPGPSTALAPLLWKNYVPVLYNDVDLYVGDYNMTTAGDVMTPVDLVRTYQSTTYTGSGPVNHNEGLDLVFRNKLRLVNGSPDFDDGEKAKIVASVIPKPNDVGYDDAYEITDHLPVKVVLTW